MKKYKESLFVVCDTCKGTHLRAMTVLRQTQFDSKTIEQVFIGLSCLTTKEKQKLSMHPNIKIIYA